MLENRKIHEIHQFGPKSRKILENHDFSRFRNGETESKRLQPHVGGTWFGLFMTFPSRKNILTKIFFARPIYKYSFRWWKTAKSMKSINFDQNQGKSLEIMILLFSIIENHTYILVVHKIFCQNVFYDSETSWTKRIKCPRRAVATVSTRFPHSEILKNHDFQGFSLILGLSGDFWWSAVFHHRNPSKNIGRSKNIFLELFFLTREHHK